ncbi:MAG: CPBP family intramembrane glutamic endopeptidase [Promethearchaeota archaeon]
MAETLQKERLSGEGHLSFLIGFLLSIFTLTLVYIALPNPGTDDKVLNTGWRGLLLVLEIIIILIVQAIVDKLLEDKKDSFSSRITGRFKQFGFTLANRPLKDIARDTALILFCFIIPLDFISYVIPGILEYLSNVPGLQFFNGLTLEQFIFLGLIYNLITGVKEEFVFRGWIQTRLKQNGRRDSAWITTALFFGLMHVELSALVDFPAGPATWFISAFVVGLVFGAYSLSTRTIVPLIIAHAMGNFISSFSLWSYTETGGFAGTGVYSFLLTFYGPLMLVGLVLALAWRKRIAGGLQYAKRLFKQLVHEPRLSDVALITGMIIVMWVLGMFLAI